ncbi:MAG: ATP-dependent DNA ligase [Candidatus Hodarchaeota archaeon]
MLYKRVVQFYERLEKTTSRLEMIEILQELFSATDPSSDDLSQVCYLLTDSIFLPWEEGTLGLAEKMVIKALAMRTRNISTKKLEQLLQKYGDVGKVAEKIAQRGSQQTLVQQKPLSLNEVYLGLRSLAQLEGKGSAKAKLDRLAGLFHPMTPLEARYLARTIVGDLRLGIGVQTLLDALAAEYLGSKEEKKPLEKAFNVFPDIGAVARLVRDKGKAGLAISPQVNVPIRPMAAQRLSSPEEIMEKMKNGCIAEKKYDGERVQIHKDGNQVILFSRNLDRITSQYPDAVTYLQLLPVQKAILEGEIVCFDFENEQFQPFQKLMRRRRKYGIEEASKEFPIIIYLFDLMLVQAQSNTELEIILEKPYPMRRKKLSSILQGVESKHIQMAEGRVVSNAEELESVFMEAIQEGTEGLIAKSTSEESVYQAGARGWQWIKLKKDYIAGLSDTLDLILVGGFHGRGRRTNFYGAFLLAAYDHEKDQFMSVCKVGTGFSDSDLTELTSLADQLVTDEPNPRLFSEMIPDKWFSPKIVFEVQGAELTLSPIHTCGRGIAVKGDDSTGIALRFPRFIRLRSDKGIEDATTVKEIVEIFFRQ